MMIRICILILCLLLIQKGSAQHYETFKKAIFTDINTLNFIYKGQIILIDNFSQDDVSIVSVDTMSIGVSITFYKVCAKPDKSYLLRNNVDSTFTYYFVKDRGEKIYSLFGFYVSELRFWYHENYSWLGYSAIREVLTKSHFFEKKQIKYIVKSLKSNSLYLDNKCNLPCVILKSYYRSDTSHKNACSYILPVDIKEFNAIW